MPAGAINRAPQGSFQRFFRRTRHHKNMGDLMKIGTRFAAGLLAITATLLADTKVKMEDLPAAVQQAVKERIKSATLVGLSKEVEKGKTTYEAETKVNGKSRDIEFDSKGAVLTIEEEVDLSVSPQPREQRFRQSRWRHDQEGRVGYAWFGHQLRSSHQDEGWKKYRNGSQRGRIHTQVEVCMRRPAGYLYLTIGVSIAVPVLGIAQDREVSWTGLLPNMLEDQQSMWTFPARLDRPKDFVPTLVVAGVAAALFLAADPPVAHYFRNTGQFGDFNHVFSSYNTSIAPVVAPAALLLTGWITKDKKMRDTALFWPKRWPTRRSWPPVLRRPPAASALALSTRTPDLAIHFGKASRR